MFTILACITQEHDLRLVFLAAMVCAAGAAITVRLLIRAQEEATSARTWPCLAGVSFGAAVWSTHFIAMLAFQPSMGLDYAIAPTLLSLLLAIMVSTAAFVAFNIFKFPGAASLSGALVGLGVAGMHYLGMHALDDAGLLSWSADFVAASIFIAAGLGAVAMAFVVRRKHLFATVSFVAAICAHHFTGMAGVTIQPLASGADAPSILPTTMIAAAAACGAMLIVGTGLLAYYIDQRASAQAGKRIKDLADAAIEGLLLIEGGRIIDWNKSFESLSGYDRQSGVQLILGDIIKELALGDRARVQARHVLVCADGSAVPIDVLSSSASPGEQIIAVRDLRDKLASEARIHFLAHYDSLTGLPNRVAFLEHLDAALAPEQASAGGLSVMAIDLDRFKEVNDVFGHGMGDRVLSLVADRMRAVLAKDEFLARVGGDEFVAVQLGGSQPEAATHFCDRLVQAATTPMEIDGNVIQLGVSIGISLYPKDGQSSSDLMANADLAMYRAKESISSGGCFFSSEMDDRIRLRRSLARDLREAIDRGQLELYYQVQTSLTTSAVVGYEVLLRWNHPERGFIPPAHFIPIAEETGLIIQIGEWVIDAACRDAASWPEPYRVAVNVSGVQFSQGDLPGVVHAALFKSGLAPNRLELEITETVLISDLDRALAILRRLKGLGVSIAMDDFGTGYSSLSTLKAFPFDKIKIDRSFIEQVESQPQARSIIRAILALGRSLEIPVLAEGVETSGHLAFLRDEGCDEAQGYLLGHPGPLGDIPALKANDDVVTQARRSAPRATASS